jgi:hypothetical protein
MACLLGCGSVLLLFKAHSLTHVCKVGRPLTFNHYVYDRSRSQVVLGNAFLAQAWLGRSGKLKWQEDSFTIFCTEK